MHCFRLILLIGLSFFVLVSGSLSPRSEWFVDAAGEEQPPLRKLEQKAPELAPQAAGAILIEADTGQILYEKKMNQQLAIASITKVMTALLAMEALQNKSLTLNDEIEISANASSMSGARLFLSAGERYRAEELIRAMMAVSANDATLAIAEHLGGNEQAFVELMNKRAKQLGMVNTKFANPHGLPVKNQLKEHYSSAHDVALMSRELLKYPGIFKYTSSLEYPFQRQDGKTAMLRNSNPLLGTYKGMDGLKTGFTFLALHCLVATAKRENMRLIAVVLGEPTKFDRIKEVGDMLDYGFEQFKIQTLIEKGEPLTVVEVYKGVQTKQVVVAPQAYSVLMKKNDKLQQYTYKIERASDIRAPLAIGDRIGTVTILYNGKPLDKYPLEIHQSVEKAGFFDLLSTAVRTLFFVEER